MKSSSFDIPIINVGNISAGGNGKTPQVEYLINLLTPQYRVGVLSRGYGRSSKGFLEVLADGSPREMGDEPLQIKRKFGDKVQVFVGENRVEAVTKILFQNPEIQVIVLDDAFQHRAIKAGFNILLSDYNHLFIEDKLLPLGRLRENIKGAKRAQTIVVTKCQTDLAVKEKALVQKKLKKYCSNVFFSSLSYGQIYPMMQSTIADDEINPSVYILVAGIAKPLLLEKYAKANFNIADKIFFKDHHSFTNFDIVAIEKKIINFAPQNLEVLTTEKDAVRFLDFYNHRRPFNFNVNVLPVVPQFMGDDKTIFDELILDYVRESVRDY